MEYDDTPRQIKGRNRQSRTNQERSKRGEISNREGVRYFPQNHNNKHTQNAEESYKRTFPADTIISESGQASNIICVGFFFPRTDK